jgi:hypothetical protein
MSVRSLRSFWVAPPVAMLERALLWEHGASHFQRRRLVGGRLYLTDKHLVFQPNRLEVAARAKPWSVELHEIAAVGPESWLRRRLRIDVTDQPSHCFFVTGIDRTGEQLVALINRLR